MRRMLYRGSYCNLLAKMAGAILACSVERAVVANENGIGCQLGTMSERGRSKFRSSSCPNPSDAQVVGASGLAERNAGNNNHTVTLARKSLLLHHGLSDGYHLLVGTYVCRLYAGRTP